MEDDTIVAVSTPPGRGALGLVRLSGLDSQSLAHRLTGRADLRPRHATHGLLVSEAGRRIDDAVVTVFPGPHSFTGEDVVEISCHGNPVILDMVVAECLALGARAAQPGEFTLRAYLNGRIDLTQAEAITDLIEARSDAGLGLALQQLEGELGRRVEPIRSQLLDLLAHVTALVEFSEEDLPPVATAEINSTLDSAEREVGRLLTHAHQGQVLQHGVSLAIVGAPNAGKSSILNALLGRDRAIVTNLPGTTRDTLEEELSLSGIVFRVVDTAGIGETNDPIEVMGILRSREAVLAADLVLLVVDGSRPLDAGDQPVLTMLQASKSALAIALNKSDLERKASIGGLEAEFPEATILETCAIRPDGIDSLRAILPELALAGPTPDGFVVSNQRHIQALHATRAAIEQSLCAVEEGLPLDLISLDVRSAVECLGHILGIGVGDEVLDRIFSRFCIGK